MSKNAQQGTARSGCGYFLIARQTYNTCLVRASFVQSFFSMLQHQKAESLAATGIQSEKKFKLFFGR